MSGQQGGTKPKKSLEPAAAAEQLPDVSAPVSHENKPPPPFPARMRRSVFYRKRPGGNGAIARKEPAAGLFLRRWCGCRHRATGSSHGSRGGGRRGSPILRCLRRCHDSGVAGGGGGGRLDCRLPDRFGAEVICVFQAFL